MRQTDGRNRGLENENTVPVMGRHTRDPLTLEGGGVRALEFSPLVSKPTAVEISAQEQGAVRVSGQERLEAGLVARTQKPDGHALLVIASTVRSSRPRTPGHPYAPSRSASAALPVAQS